MDRSSGNDTLSYIIIGLLVAVLAKLVEKFSENKKGADEPIKKRSGYGKKKRKHFCLRLLTNWTAPLFMLESTL